MTQPRVDECLVSVETFESISRFEKDPGLTDSWPGVFVLPSWIQTWWKSFGGSFEPLLLSIRRDNRTLGLALLKKQNSSVSFMGSTDVCDYLDFVIAPEQGPLFFATLFDYLIANQVTEMDLRCLRPDSCTTSFLMPGAKQRGYGVACAPDGASFEMDLPDTWVGYLDLLNGKQRHEVKRKLRRLHDAGAVGFEVIHDLNEQKDKMDLFFTLFIESRKDKSEFMTEQMAGFFKDLIHNLSKAGILKQGLMTLDAKPVATVLFFDFKNAIYLYNSGFDVAYSHLSVGLLCKVLTIEYGIHMNRKIFDFLKGEEIYKTRLGGKETALSRCHISFS